MCKANNLVWQKHRIYEENHDKTAVRAYSPQYLPTYGDRWYIQIITNMMGDGWGRAEQLEFMKLVIQVLCEAIYRYSDLNY